MKSPIARSKLFLLQSIPGGTAVFIMSLTWLLVSAVMNATIFFSKTLGGWQSLFYLKEL